MEHCSILTKQRNMPCGSVLQNLILKECTDAMISRYAEINKRYWKRLEAGEITKEQVLLERFSEFFQKEHIRL